MGIFWPFWEVKSLWGGGYYEALAEAWPQFSAKLVISEEKKTTNQLYPNFIGQPPSSNKRAKFAYKEDGGQPPRGSKHRGGGG